MGCCPEMNDNKFKEIILKQEDKNENIVSMTAHDEVKKDIIEKNIIIKDENEEQKIYNTEPKKPVFDIKKDENKKIRKNKRNLVVQKGNNRIKMVMNELKRLSVQEINDNQIYFTKLQHNNSIDFFILYLLYDFIDDIFVLSSINIDNISYN